MSDQNTSFFKKFQPFIIGGISGCTATSIIQPMDMIKVRIQIRSEEFAAQGIKGNLSPFDVLKEIKAKDGILGFYKGLDSALTRQVFYTTSRLGLYKTFFNMAKDAEGKVSGLKKSVCALSAGFLASLIGNPADLALIRMQNDLTLPEDQRRNYKSVVDAFTRIVKEEGVLELWRGCEPTVLRAMVINLGMLAPYDEVKERLNAYYGTKDTVPTRLIASAVAGFLASFCSLPFDNIKTRLQRMKKDPNGAYPYSGIVDCFSKSVSRGGVTSLWAGFPTFYFRIAPHTMITLLVQDALTRYANKHF